jgi:hypothetical protein
MIIQKWTAKVAPLQLNAFLATLKELNALYHHYGRVAWGRVHHELYGGHVVYMEREFPTMVALDADESQAQAEDIRAVKKRLLESTVPGTVELSYYQTREV